MLISKSRLLLSHEQEASSGGNNYIRSLFERLQK